MRIHELSSITMANPVLLEVCVESLGHAVAAEHAGADRIELCSDLRCGGLTPDATLMRNARQQLRIPIHGLIRPRPGDFCYSEREIETMKRDIGAAKEIGLDGIVLGVLDQSQRVDLERTRDLVMVARPLPVTFHRAFDKCPDLSLALEAVIETGATRLLTSGGKARVIDNLGSVAHLLETARDRIVVMPGGGIRTSNVERILRHTSAREIHTSLGTSGMKPNDALGLANEIPSHALSKASFEEKVRKFKRVLHTLSS